MDVVAGLGQPCFPAEGPAEMKWKYLFGPVASRRLGRSLGVDFVQMKTCPFDCVYCEVAPTTNRTTQRRRFFPPEEILAELEAFFAGGGQADYITLTGSGEPTLSSDLGFLVRETQKRFKRPVAVITNGALLTEPEVRDELMNADLVMPSLDAARQESFEAANRPAEGIDVESIIDGLAAFSRQYGGKLWLEVLLVEGLNDSDDDVEALSRAIARIAPERVQLNTVVRPGVLPSARAVSPERLEEIAARLSKAAPTEIIAPAELRASATAERPESAILETLRRRPCTADDLAAGLSLETGRVKQVLSALIEAGEVRETRFGSGVFYEAS